jgi:hypothetical protein
MIRVGMLILRLYVLVSLFCFAHPPARGFAQTEPSRENQPLPEMNAFLDRIKDNLKSDRLLLCQYTYNMKSSTRYLDKEGRVKKIETREYEVFPSLDEDMAYEKLVSEDGRPLDAGKLEEQDRKYKKKADARARKLARERKSDQEERLAKESEEGRKERETIEDLFKLYEFTFLRREMIGSHSAIWIEFTPKSQYQPQTKDGHILKKLRGRALVSDTDYQVIRVDVELSEDLSFGLGLLARMHKGATLRFMRRKINNEIWLPAEFRFIGSARVLLLKQLRVESTSFFSEYRKYSVSSTYKLMPGKPSR